MSEERFDQLDRKFDQLDRKLDALVQTVDTRFGAVGQRFDAVDERLDRLEAGQTELREGIVMEVRRLDGKIDTVDLHMHVLHESVMAKLAALPEATCATRTDMTELRDSLDHRITPLEAAVKHHTAEINQLKNASDG